MQGPNTVSVSQLPAESDEGNEFKALKTISRLPTDQNAPEFELETHKVDKEADYVDPMNWFGILVPQSLKTARDRYEKAVELVIESANVEQRLKKNYQLFENLKRIKADFKEAEE